MDQQQPTFIGIVLVAVIVLLVVAFLWAQGSRSRRERSDLAERELAVIEETIRMTNGGLTSLVLLAGAILGTLFAFSAATTVFQQIEAGVMFIGSAVIFGLGIALGRRRTYTIYRSKKREPA